MRIQASLCFGLLAFGLCISAAASAQEQSADYGGDLVAAYKQIKARSLVLSFSTDWRFNTARAREVVQAMVRAGVDVSFAEISTTFGHDSFLMPVPDYLNVFGAYMQAVST